MNQETSQVSNTPIHPEKHQAAHEHPDKVHRTSGHPGTGAQGERSRRSEKLGEQRARAKKKLQTRLVIMVIVIVVAAYTGLTFTSTNAFCGGCHEMGPDYDSWQESTHRNVKCVQCHIGPGFFNLIAHKIASMKSLYAHFTDDYEKPINADGSYAEEIQDAYCLQCHQDILSQKAVKEAKAAGVRPAHERHINTDLKCSVCHNRVAHKMKGYKDKSKMEACLSCHQNSGSSSNCTLCHSNKFLLENNQ